ncbi:predicted protein [Enterococcus gallinarum EG2]|nr:predicted protein [Enterococcus gallinarum EG2]
MRHAFSILVKVFVYIVTCFTFVSSRLTNKWESFKVYSAVEKFCEKSVKYDK